MSQLSEEERAGGEPGVRRAEGTRACVTPLRVSSSIRLMTKGLFRNFSLNCFTVTGKVAE